MLALVLSYLACRYIVTAKVGRVLRAVRDAESRLMFCGYDSKQYKLFVWVFSAVLCGIAGALYVPQVGIINPSELQPSNSIEMAIWTAVGGRGTLLGAALGAFVVNGAKSFFTGALPELWLYILGAMFILTTLFMPQASWAHFSLPLANRQAKLSDSHVTGRADWRPHEPSKRTASNPLPADPIDDDPRPATGALRRDAVVRPSQRPKSKKRAGALA